MTTIDGMQDPGFREFVADPQAPGADHVWHDTCGEYALEFAIADTEGRKATPGDMLALTHDMVAHGEHHSGTTLAGLADEAKRRGHKPELFEGKTNEEYHAFLKANVGKRPVVMLFQLAENLMDAETGIGYSFRVPFKQDLAHHSLRGHYICVLDSQPHGWVAADGANPQAPTRFAVYTWDTLQKSDIVGMLVLEYPKGARPVTTPAPYTKNSDGTLTYKNGNIGVGFANLVESQGRLADLVIPETYINPNEAFCLFADGAVYFYSHTDNTCDDTHAAHVVDALFRAWQSSASKPTTVVTKTEVPAALAGAIADALNVLQPFVNAAAELRKANHA